MMHSILSNDLAYAIAWTLVHSLWQIMLVAVLLKLTLRFIGRSQSEIRYVVALSFLGMCFLMSLVTFASYYMEDSVILVRQAMEITPVTTGASAQIPESSASFVHKLEYYFPLILNIWILGTFFLLLRMAGGFVYMKKLTRSARSGCEKLTGLVRSLNKKFRINRKLDIRESLHIYTPMVTGYLKPVILFPVGLVNQLNTNEVECIIAHELAHIKRHDFIFNILQMFAEAFYYYHPGIWYISSLINAERENCCDDLAIACCGSNISYAKTLLKLQEMKQNSKLRPALALSGQSNTFSQRIMRILNQGSVNTHYREKLLAFGLVFIGLFIGAGNLNSKAETINPENSEIYILDECVSNDKALIQYLDTIPEKKQIHIKKLTDSSSVEMKMEDGDVVELRIDGKNIDPVDFDKHQDVILELKPGKRKKIITVMPDNRTQKMRIRLIDSVHNHVIEVDSILEEMSFPEFEFHMEELRHDPKFVYKFMLDSLVNNEMAIIEKEINIDSIIELIPEKMPKIYFHKDDNNVRERIIVELRESEEKLDEMRHELRGFQEEEENKAYKLRQIEKEQLRKGLDENRFEWHNKDRDVHLNGFYETRELGKNRMFYSGNGNVSDKIMNALLKDGLIQPDEKTDIELSGKFMKVNGDKQPDNIWKKYKKIYEDHTGIELTKKSKLKFDLDPKDVEEEENIFIIRRNGLK